MGREERRGGRREASRMGVTRQSIIKLWLAERLDGQPHPADSTLHQAGEA